MVTGNDSCMTGVISSNQVNCVWDSTTSFPCIWWQTKLPLWSEILTTVLSDIWIFTTRSPGGLFMSHARCICSTPVKACILNVVGWLICSNIYITHTHTLPWNKWIAEVLLLQHNEESFLRSEGSRLKNWNHGKSPFKSAEDQRKAQDCLLQEAQLISLFFSVLWSSSERRTRGNHWWLERWLELPLPYENTCPPPMVEQATICDWIENMPGSVRFGFRWANGVSTTSHSRGKPYGLKYFSLFLPVRSGGLMLKLTFIYNAAGFEGAELEPTLWLTFTSSAFSLLWSSSLRATTELI